MKKVYPAIFLALLAFFSGLTFLRPGTQYAADEKREPVTLPQAEKATLLDGSFQIGLEEFLRENLPLRDVMLAGRTEVQLLLGQQEINGIYVTEDRLMENLQSPDASLTQMNCDQINGFLLNFRDIIGSATVMLVPTALEIYAQERPLFSETMDQITYIQNFYKALPYSRNIDPSSSLIMESDQYIYYRTDHRLTSFGGYTLYNALAKSLGYRASALSGFDVEHISHDFLGTLYSAAPTGKELADTIALYTPTSGSVVSRVIQHNGDEKTRRASLIDRDEEEQDPYRVFGGKDAEVTRIWTNVRNGKHLLVFADDLIWPMLQFLTLHYEEIAVVDLKRLEHSLYNYVNPIDYEQVLFLYGLSSFTTDAGLDKLKEYCI